MCATLFTLPCLTARCGAGGTVSSALVTVILIGAAVLAVIGISWISISLENGLTAAGVIAVTALSFNLLLINEVAVPFSSLRSDKEIGLELAQSYRAVDENWRYGKYSTIGSVLFRQNNY